MPDQSLSDVVDAIAADLAGLGLPAHSEWLYTDPPILRPDKGTLLGVFVREGAYAVLATNDSYTQDDTIVIAWYVPLIASPETGGAGDQTVSKSALADAETILARLRTYATEIPGVTDQNEATLTGARYGILQGTFVWAAEFTLHVSRWPSNA